MKLSKNSIKWDQLVKNMVDPPMALILLSFQFIMFTQKSGQDILITSFYGNVITVKRF